MPPRKPLPTKRIALQRGRALRSAEMREPLQIQWRVNMLQRGRALRSAEMRSLASAWRARPCFNGAAL